MSENYGDFSYGQGRGMVRTMLARKRFRFNRRNSHLHHHTTPHHTTTSHQHRQRHHHYFRGEETRLSGGEF